MKPLRDTITKLHSVENENLTYIEDLVIVLQRFLRLGTICRKNSLEAGLAEDHMMN